LKVIEYLNELGYKERFSDVENKIYKKNSNLKTEIIKLIKLTEALNFKVKNE
jgi:hypothetical protein